MVSIYLFYYWGGVWGLLTKILVVGSLTTERFIILDDVITHLQLDPWCSTVI